MIELINFSKSYNTNEKFFVKDISFVADKGKVTAILGPNGAGKSTILKAIYSLHYATSGNIFVSDYNGVKYNTQNNSKIIKNIVGFVPEKSNLPKEFTPFEILLERVGLCNFSKEEKQNAISRVIKICNLSEVLNKKIKTLSKGFVQRLLFALALVYDPPNIILDELTSGLDPAQIAQMRDIIKTLAKTKTVLLSTHIMQEVSAIADNIIILANGNIVASGTEEDIIKSSKKSNLESAFLHLTNSSRINL